MAVALLISLVLAASAAVPPASSGSIEYAVVWPGASAVAAFFTGDYVSVVYRGGRVAYYGLGGPGGGFVDASEPYGGNVTVSAADACPGSNILFIGGGLGDGTGFLVAVSPSGVLDSIVVGMGVWLVDAAEGCRVVFVYGNSVAYAGFDNGKLRIYFTEKPRGASWVSTAAAAGDGAVYSYADMLGRTAVRYRGLGGMNWSVWTRGEIRALGDAGPFIAASSSTVAYMIDKESGESHPVTPATLIIGSAAVRNHSLVAAKNTLYVYRGDAQLETQYSVPDTLGTSEVFIKKLYARDTAAGPRALIATTDSHVLLIDPVHAKTIWVWSNETLGAIKAMDIAGDGKKALILTETPGERTALIVIGTSSLSPPTGARGETAATGAEAGEKCMDATLLIIVGAAITIAVATIYVLGKR